MTLCEKCIHEEVCDQSSRRMWSAMAGEKECSDFKNKADFVEVVRCINCKSRMFSDMYIECSKRLEIVRADHFCSDGERREKE